MRLACRHSDEFGEAPEEQSPAATRTVPLNTPWLLMLAALIGGCMPQVAKNTGSPYYKVPPGSVIYLEQRIAIPTGHTRVWIQGGRIVGTGFNSFEPSCNVEVTYLDEAATQYVEPGKFRVTKTQFLREAISSSRRVLVAAKGEMVADAMDSGGDEFFYEGYHLWVENPEQPDVRRFTCRGLYGFPYETRPPTIVEIQSAFGPIATLELPGDADTASEQPE